MDVETQESTLTSPVGSVDRALRTLDAVAAAGPAGISLAELSSRLGVHKTTVHRSLAALRHRDYVSQDPATGRYNLGLAGIGLADRYFSEDDLPVRMHGALVAVCSATDELVHLGVLSGAHVIYLDKVEPDRPVRVWSAIGRKNWAATTALGRALLASSSVPPSVLAGYARAVQPPGRIDVAHLASELDAARERGFAVEVQENEPGIACLAVPLLRGTRPVAALSITAPSDRMSPDRMRRLHEQLLTVGGPLLPPGLSFWTN